MTVDLFSDDRAVRNLIGYVLTFAIIVTSVGIVSTTGYQQLTEFREHEQRNNAERSLELVADNFDDLQQGRASARAGEVDLAGGDLTVTEGARIRVAVTGTDYDRTMDVNGLRYQYGGAAVAYENGALFRTDERGNAGLVSEPRLVCEGDRALVSVVSLQTDDVQHVGGGSVQVASRVETREVTFPINRTGKDSVGDADDVVVELSSEHADGWAQYFRDAGDWTDAAATDTYRCDDVAEVYVRRTNVTVTLRTD